MNDEFVALIGHCPKLKVEGTSVLLYCTYRYKGVTSFLAHKMTIIHCDQLRKMTTQRDHE